MARKINAEWWKKIRRLGVLTFFKQGLEQFSEIMRKKETRPCLSGPHPLYAPGLADLGERALGR